MPESLTYKNMLTEVEAIVQKLQNQDIDLDQMVSEVERGYGLIKEMRARLNATKGKIEDIRAQFQAE